MPSKLRRAQEQEHHVDVAPGTKRLRRWPWFVVTSLVPVLAVALVVLHATGYGITGKHQASAQADHPVPGGGPEPQFTPTASQATVAPSSAPIPGVTVAAITSKLPASWKATFKLDKGTNGRGYSASTAKALAGAQLDLGIILSASNQASPIDQLGCQLIANGLKPNKVTFGVLTECLRAALPPTDAQRAASWIEQTAPGLSGHGDLRNINIGSYAVYLEHTNYGLGVIIRGSS
jgi:hypothetical protein